MIWFGFVASVKAKIAAVNAEMLICLEANDLDCLLKLYDEDVRLMHDNHPTTIGKTSKGEGDF